LPSTNRTDFDLCRRHSDVEAGGLGLDLVGLSRSEDLSHAACDLLASLLQADPAARGDACSATATAAGGADHSQPVFSLISAHPFFDGVADFDDPDGLFEASPPAMATGTAAPAPHGAAFARRKYSMMASPMPQQYMGADDFDVCALAPVAFS
jgi:hypothetical protein